jgi:type I restriction enzyme, S subunit
MTEPLPQRWTWATLEQVARWGSGGTPKATERSYYGGEIPWAVIGDLTDGLVVETQSSITDTALANSSAKIVPAGTVLLAMYGSIGKLGITGIPMATNQAIAFARPIEDVLLPRYLFWYLRQQRGELGAAGKGATQRNISQTVLKTWPIPLAPLAEQARIVAAIEERFSHLDAGLGALARAMRNLQQLKASVLDGVVRGSLGPIDDLAQVADFDEQSALRRKPPAAPPTRPSWVPGSWGWTSVDALAVLVTDGDHNPPKRVLAGIPHITAKGIKHGKVVFEGCTYVTSEDYVRSARRYAPIPNDVIITCVGTIGEVAVVPEGLVFNADRNLAAIRLPPTGMVPEFLALVLRSGWMQAQIRSASGSTAQPHLYLGDLRALGVPVPSHSDQQAILNEAERQFSMIEVLEGSLTTTQRRGQALRKAILSAAFNGKLVDQDSTEEPASDALKRIIDASVNKVGSTRRRGSI